MQADDNARAVLGRRALPLLYSNKGVVSPGERSVALLLSADYIAASLQSHASHALPPRTPCNAIMTQHESQLLDLIEVLDPGYPAVDSASA
jgi:hypothetical protein